jgi:hypothetical protein
MAVTCFFAGRRLAPFLTRASSTGYADSPDYRALCENIRVACDIAQRALAAS